jgi:hypothetical protein
MAWTGFAGERRMGGGRPVGAKSPRSELRGLSANGPAPELAPDRAA